MRREDKKTLKEIIGRDWDNARDAVNTLLERIEELKNDHQDWIDEHDCGWEDTPTGERATDDQYNLEEWWDKLDDIVTELDGVQDEISSNI